MIQPLIYDLHLHLQYLLDGSKKTIHCWKETVVEWGFVDHLQLQHEASWIDELCEVWESSMASYA